MRGRNPSSRPEGLGGRGPSWLRFGCLLAIGEAVILALVFVHPGAIGTRLATGHVASPGAHFGDGPTKNLTAPTPTTAIPAAPHTTVPSTPTMMNPAGAPPPSPTASVRSDTARVTLSANIAPQPNFLQSCSGAQFDNSARCVGATLQAIANARSQEGLSPMVLPSNWSQLTPEQQIFVSTNIERIDRGLPPMTAMSTVLNQSARQGAGQSIDPAPPRDFPYSQWGSNWAGAVGNPLEADYFWMYDDGTGSANIDCTPSNSTGCWGHRQNILLNLACNLCVMGTGWDATGYSGDPSMTELLVEATASPSVEFTWQQESAFLP